MTAITASLQKARQERIAAECDWVMRFADSWLLTRGSHTGDVLTLTLN
jgi:hypothetical protein